MDIRPLRSVVAAFAVLSALGTGLAIAQPTLTGEFFNGPLTLRSASCGPSGEIQFIDFVSSGPAVGPFTGTYSEDGQIVVNATSRSLHARFTVNTASGDFVQGRKDFTPDVGLVNGSCFVDVAGNFNIRFDAVVRYTAFGSAGGGPFNDEGFTNLRAVFVGMIGTTGIVSAFNESFTSTLPQTGPALVTLEPAFDENPVNTAHTVTATVLTATGQPVENILVVFIVEGSVSTFGTCTTNASGQCSFTYQGPPLPGADHIRAFADTDEDGRQDPGEPSGEAAKVWILPASTPGHVTGGGQAMKGTVIDAIVFGFNARSDGMSAAGHCNVIDRTTGTHIRCLDVTTLVQTPTHATLRGNAVIDGVPTTYQIDVDDLAEPGSLRDTFVIQTSSGYSAGGLVTRGNVQIHRN